ncbi:MAG: APC family permease [Acetobacteraceae bacterium]
MQLVRNLGLLEAIALSTSVIAPTMAMAFNVTLTAQAAGPAAPLSFAIGTLVLAIVGLSFIAFARRMAHAGSAYAYLQASFGPGAGFIAGWLLLLTYLCFASGTATLVGVFVHSALSNYGLSMPNLWLPLGVAAALLATLCAYRDMVLATRLMLALEAVSVIAILVLCGVVLWRVAMAGGLSLAPFRPTAAFGGWGGVGFGLVYAVLSFAGFEGATTLGEEMRHPYRDIPRAVLGTVLAAGGFYVLVSYTQVVGFGIGDIATLAKAEAPLNTLANRFATRELATAIDLAAAVSAFACALGSLSAAARMMFALGRGWGVVSIGAVHPSHGTPARAVVLSGAIMIAGLLGWAPFLGPSTYYGCAGTIGTLALILVYLGVTLGEARSALARAASGGVALGVVGTLLLLWPLGNSLIPVPPPPYNGLPYVVVFWAIAGLVAIARRRVVLDATIRFD